MNDYNKQNPKNNDQVARQLEIFRNRIDSIDDRLISLLSERQKEVERVVALKKEHHLPVYHPAREEDVISNRRAKALEHNLDQKFIEDIFRAILRRSRISQTHSISTKGIRDGATVLIVGGKGIMGSYLAKWFFKSGYKTRILDKDDWPHVDKLCSEIDLAIISTPVKETEQIITRLGPHLPAGCVLADVTSIKNGPLKAMCKAHPGPVIGLHPVFGPNTTSMDKQLVIFTPGRDLEQCQWVIDQFAAWGGVIVKADPEKHDEDMGIIQALRHFATFVFGQFLYKKKIDIHKTLEYSSPIYRLELGMVGRLFAQDPSLYAAIIFSLPERRTLLNDYINSLKENLKMLEAGDDDEFCKEFKNISEWFGTFADQAMRESSYLIDKLIERF